MTMLGRDFDLGGLKPIGQDKKGLMFRKSDVSHVVIEEIASGQSHTKRRAKTMSEKISEATEIIEETTRLFDSALTNLVNKEIQISEKSKQVSGSVRDSANKLGEGLARVEKAADFNKLERYVDLLERAASAFSVLAELEKSGRLEKIAASIR